MINAVYDKILIFCRTEGNRQNPLAQSAKILIGATHSPDTDGWPLDGRLMAVCG